MATLDTIKQNILPTIPHQPGIYKYYDDKDRILYVGKAKDLRKRVSSYFNKQHPDGKTNILVRKISRIEFTVVETEQDALLLENVLIKQLQPRYNILLKDDKTYPYICIKKEPFPRVFLTRNPEKDGAEYLGPYTSVAKVRVILELLHRLFYLRTCQLALYPAQIAAQKFRACLEYHIGNCKAPCIGLQTEEMYLQNIAQVRHILKGNFSAVTAHLKEKMNEFAENFEFEKAQEIKEKLLLLQDYQSKSTIVNPKINDIDVFSLEETEKSAYISYLKVMNGTIIQTKVLELGKRLDEQPEDLLLFGIHELRQRFDSHSPEIIVPFALPYPDKSLKLTIPQIGDKQKLLALAQKNAFYYRKQQETAAAKRKRPEERAFDILNQLKNDLRLTEIPLHIECFDNSNLHGTNPVSSMVLFREGKPAKKEYRHYHVKTVIGANDFATMEEVVFRRYKRLLDEKRMLPQLVVIDGGKGQLAAAMAALQRLQLVGKMAVVGIAKRLEEIYVPNDSLPLHLDKRSPALKLLQHIRNEAHRFAITFHRQVRAKNTFTSELEQIKGIGKTSIDKLLRHFKGIEPIRQATAEQLSEVVNKQQAAAIIAYFAETKNAT